MNSAFQSFFAMVERACGITLDMTKDYLLESRLAPLARRNGSASVEEFVAELTRRPIGPLHREAFEALTTHETRFFRDEHCFDRLATAVLPDLIRKRGRERTLRIWSAGAATGQEPYSVAMLLREQLVALDQWDMLLLATDFSQRALDKAASGHYSPHELSRGLDPARMARHFIDTSEGLAIRPEVRSLVRFERLNLIEPWPPMPVFDLILLRNVLIYFSPATRARVLERIHRALHPTDGILLLGATEMLSPGSQFALTQLDRLSFYRPLPAHTPR